MAPSWGDPTGPASAGLLFCQVIGQEQSLENCPAAGQKDKPPALPPDRRCPRGSTGWAVRFDKMPSQDFTELFHCQA